MKIKNKNVRGQIFKAEWAKQKADLARFELIHFQDKTQTVAEKLCWQLPVVGRIISMIRQTQAAHLKKQVIELSQKAVEEGVKMFVVIAGRRWSSNSSLEDLMEQAGKYLSTAAREKISATFLSGKLDSHSLTCEEVISFGWELEAICFTFERQIELLNYEL